MTSAGNAKDRSRQSLRLKSQLLWSNQLQKLDQGFCAFARSAETSGCMQSFSIHRPLASQNFKSGFNPRQMVPAVPNCMVLDQELGRERCVGVQRDGRGGVELFVTKCAHRFGGCTT